MSFKIWNDDPQGRGYNTHVEIDGEDVSGSIQELAIHAAVKGPVTVMLDPIVVQGTPLPGRPVRLLFGSSETQALLVKHGWTPPAEDGSETGN